MTQSATAESFIAVSSAEAGPSGPRAKSWNSACITAVAMLAGEARPPGIAKQGATTKPELVESSGGAGALLVRSKWHAQCRRYSSRKVCA